MKKLLFLTFICLIFTLNSCETDESLNQLEEQSLNEDLSLKAASVTNTGTTLFSKYGVNLNNSYNGDNKTDWKKFWTYNSDLNTALNRLENNITNFKIYRVGFSRPMANDDADLSEWADALTTLRDHGPGNKMIICSVGRT